MKLIDYLPENYRSSAEMVALQEAIQPEIDALWEMRNDFLLQIDPTTATWGLDYWEKGLGLKSETEKPLDFRRSRVVAKLRGRGTTTVALLKEVSESFSNGEVDVVEVASEDRLEIHFVGTIGVPPNMGDLEETLNEVIPAHLAWKFVVFFRTSEELTAYTHGELAAFTHHQIREENLNAVDN